MQYFLRRMTVCCLLLVCNGRIRAQDRTREEDVKAAYVAGEEATRAGDLGAAETDFLRVLKLVPQDVGARVNLGVVYLREEKWDLALNYLKQAEKLAPQVAGIRLNIGLAYYKRGEYETAILDLGAVLKQQPNSVQARRLLGLCYLFTTRYAEAADELAPLWDESNTDVSYLYTLAVAAGNSGKRELEGRAVNQLMATAKDSPLLDLLQGKSDLAHDDYGKALTELQKAAAADPTLPMVHYNLGVVYRRMGETEKARAEFLRDTAVEPNVAFNYDQLGLLASAADQEHEAEGYFLDAVKHDHTLGTSWFGLAKIYKQQKRYGEAMHALGEAGGLDPQSASVHYLRAQVLAAEGRRDQAEAEFATVQQLKKATVDQLEREISGPKYKDGFVPVQ
jgi:Flp pilus assembly protein TadD